MSQNIADTIGCPFEIIHEDNSARNSSLSSVYNRLQKIAQHSFIIFLHEDVFFYSQNWGFVVQEILSCHKVGLLGLSGSIYKSKYPSVWSASLQSNYRISGETRGLNNNIYHKVAVIDGCFMAARKEVVERHPFDECLLGFHGYDIDISLDISKHFDVAVATEINFTHISKGNQNLDWLLSSFYVHNKWKNQLPVNVKKIYSKEKFINDYLAAQNVYGVIYNLKYSAAILLKYYLLFIFKFFKLNGLKYTKKTFLYFFCKKSNMNLS